MDKEERREAYADRQEAKRERYEDRAAKAAAASQAAYQASHRIVAGIPLGQPVLVGHHSEKRHRRDLERSDNAMRRSIEESDKAAHYSGKAASIGKGGVSSDDPDAADKLRAKLAEMEKEREFSKKVNKAWKKGKLDDLVSSGEMSEALAAATRKTMELCSFLSAPMDTKNLSANMRRMKLRIAELEKAEAEPDREDVKGEGWTVEQNKDDNRLRLFFTDRPSREHCKNLRSHGFKWAPSVGAWQRQLSNGARWNAQSVLKEMFGEEVTL